ncbi:MAG: hypothetical protein P1U58_20555 [Verrucomicrobiales bacterium]|nr:hypothetical protein [Verrucomicrobiales bacterium]
MIPKHTPEEIARLARQRQKIREEKALLHLVEERQKLSRVLWGAPLVELEKPYQRGWYREFELTDAAKRRKDADRLEELLTLVNRVECCRHGKFLCYDQDFKKRVPKKHGLKRFRLCEFRKLSLPNSLYGYFRLTGTFRPLTKEFVEELPARWSGKVVVRCSHYFASVTKPLIITQQRVDMPRVRSRIDEIENHFERSNGWGRYRRLRGESWRWYDYTTSLSERRGREAEKEMREGTTDVVPFSLLGWI